MRDRVRVGTRRSALALAQTDRVLRSLRRRDPRRTELVPIETHGDRDRTPGGSPDFTGAIEAALRRGEIDLAVHSTKDLPSIDAPGLTIAGYPRRAAVQDAVVARRWPLPDGARVGTSSLRRRAQLLRWRPDLRVEELRGNVDTRIRSVDDGSFDAVVLARAGLERLGRADRIAAVLPIRSFLPSPGQGALAVQVRSRDRPMRAWVASIDDPPTRGCVEAERALAAALGADCNVPLGCWARVRGSRMRLLAELLSEDGRRVLRAERAGPVRAPRALARRVAALLFRAGARELLARPRR